MDQPEIIEFRRIRNVPEILNVTSDFIRQNFRLLWRSLFFLVFPPIVVGITIFSYFFLSFFESLIRYNDITETSIFSLFLTSLLAGMLCAGGITMLVAVTHVFVQLYRERGPDGFAVEDVWKGVKAIFWMIFWTLFGLGTAYFILSIFAAFVPFGQFGIPIVGTFGALYFPLRIYDRRGFLKSLTVSSELITGNWWRTFGMLWLFYLLNLVFVGIFLIPLVVLGWAGEAALIDFEDLADSGSWLRIVGAVLVSAYVTSSLLLYSAPLISLIFHYYSQRERKQFIGLMEEVERIGSVEDPSLQGERGVSL